jgi:hypothetical protein
MTVRAVLRAQELITAQCEVICARYCPRADTADENYADFSSEPEAFATV